MQVRIVFTINVIQHTMSNFFVLKVRYYYISELAIMGHLLVDNIMHIHDPEYNPEMLNSYKSKLQK